jgi:hypothetical protein
LEDADNVEEVVAEETHIVAGILAVQGDTEDKVEEA